MSAFFMAVHFWRIRKDGGISGPAPVHARIGDEGTRRKSGEDSKSKRFRMRNSELAGRDAS